MGVIEMHMIHTTINTGRTTSEDPSTVTSKALDALRPIIRAGGGTIPRFDAYTVQITQTPGGATYSIHRGPDAIVFCGLAWTQEGADISWAKLEKAYAEALDNDVLVFGKIPARPAQMPWLAAILLPAIILHAEHDLSWLDHFERCLAFALMEEA